MKMRTFLLLILLGASCLYISAQVTQETYFLRVTADVTLERGSRNFNYLPYLIVGKHPGYPLKRSLMKFDNIPRDCILPLQATLHIYFVYAHKPSFMTSVQVPAVTRHVVAHTVLKSWVESQATSTKRRNGAYWTTPWLNLNGDDASPTALYSRTVPPFPGK